MTNRNERGDIVTSGNRFQELSHQFDGAVGIDAKREAADRLVRFGTAETFDALNTMRVLGKAAFLLRSTSDGNRVLGDRMVAGVDRYFTTAGMNHKLLLPFGENQQTGLAEVTQLSFVMRSMDAQIKTASGVRDFTNIVQASFSDSRLASDLAWTVIITVPKERVTDRYRQIRDSHLSLMREVGRMYAAEADPERMKASENIVMLLKNLTNVRLRNIPDVLRTPFDGFSLEDVLAEDNQEQFARKALKYIKAIPKGDYFWQRVVEGVFFTNSMRHYSVDPDTYFTDQKLFEKINFFQQTLVQRVWFGGIDQAMYDEEFDQDFRAVINSFDDTLLENLFTMFYPLSIHAPLQRRIFEPETPFEDIVRQAPVAGYLFDKLDPDGFERHVLQIDALVHRYLRNNWPFIKANILDRFPNPRVLPLLNNFENNVMSVETEEMLTRAFLATIRANAGDEFFEMLNNDEEESQASIDQIRKNIGKRTATPKWGDGSYTYVSNEDSVYHSIGIRDISLVVRKNAAYPVDFLIIGVDGVFDIAGRVEREGITFSMRLDDEKYRGMKLFLTELIYFNLQNLLETNGRGPKRQRMSGNRVRGSGEKEGRAVIDMDQVVEAMLKELEGGEDDK